jgi:hypothetical protein
MKGDENQWENEQSDHEAADYRIAFNQDYQGFWCYTVSRPDGTPVRSTRVPYATRDDAEYAAWATVNHDREAELNHRRQLLGAYTLSGQELAKLMDSGSKPPGRIVRLWKRKTRPGGS